MEQERAVLAGSCFWGMQDLICKLPGGVAERRGHAGAITVAAHRPYVGKSVRQIRERLRKDLEPISRRWQDPRIRQLLGRFHPNRLMPRRCLRDSVRNGAGDGAEPSLRICLWRPSERLTSLSATSIALNTLLPLEASAVLAGTRALRFRKTC